MREDIFHIEAETTATFYRINSVNRLKELFNDQYTEHDFRILQTDLSSFRIIGIVDPDSGMFRRYFEIILESQNDDVSTTQVCLRLSREPFEFTPECEKQQEKSIKNHNKLAKNTKAVLYVDYKLLSN